jgi:hypothetical protein
MIGLAASGACRRRRRRRCSYQRPGDAVDGLPAGVRRRGCPRLGRPAAIRSSLSCCCCCCCIAALLHCCIAAAAQRACHATAGGAAGGELGESALARAGRGAARAAAAGRAAAGGCRERACQWGGGWAIWRRWRAANEEAAAVRPSLMPRALFETRALPGPRMRTRAWRIP